MLDARPHVGDIGLELAITVVDQDDAVVDISGASGLTIYLTRPDGTVLTKAASLDTNGTDGVMKYATIAGDLSVKGTWKIQGHVSGVDGFSGSTRESTFQVNSSRHG